MQTDGCNRATQGDTLGSPSRTALRVRLDTGCTRDASNRSVRARSSPEGEEDASLSQRVRPQRVHAGSRRLPPGRPSPRPPGESPGVCRRGRSRRDTRASADGSAGACRRRKATRNRRPGGASGKAGGRATRLPPRSGRHARLLVCDTRTRRGRGQAAARQLTQPVAVTPRDIPTTAHLRQQRKKPPKLTGSDEPLGRPVSRITLT